MNTLTLAIVRGNVRNHIDEPTANYWADTELNSYIAASERKLWRKIFSLKKDYWLNTATLTLAVNQILYNGGDGSGMPSDIWRVESIRMLTSGYQNVLWMPADADSPAFLDGLNTDFPVCNPYQVLYALRNMGTLAISPAPQISGLAGLKALINYIQQPTPMVVDTDTFLIPDAFMDFVEYDASLKALSKGPVGDSAAWKTEAAESWKEIMEALDTPRSSQGPDTVVGFGSYGGD